MESALWFVGVVFVMAALLLLISHWMDSRSVPTWEVLAEGALKRLEEEKSTYSHQSGAMVHHTTQVTRYRTHLHFEGGTVIYGIPCQLKHPGTILVRLMKESHGQYRLDPYGEKK